MSGSVSRGKNDPSQSLQMIQRPLMTPDELKSLPKGNFIVSKTGTHPMKTKLKLFLKWGITFEEPHEIEEKSARKVAYADKQEIDGTCYPAIGTIARDLSLSASTVKRAVGDLEKNGFIRKKQRWRDNGGKSSLLFEIIK